MPLGSFVSPVARSGAALRRGGGSVVVDENGDVQVTGALDVTGAVTLDSTLTIKGSLLFADGNGVIIDFGMDQRDSFVTGTDGAYAYSGKGPGGTIPAGTLVLQSRSDASRSVMLVTGSTPAIGLEVNGSQNVSIPNGTLSTTGAATLDTGGNGSSFGGDLQISGVLNHDGASVGLFGTAPASQPTTGGTAEAAFVENSGGTAVNVDSTFGGYTLQQIAQALQDIGALA